MTFNLLVEQGQIVDFCKTVYTSALDMEYDGTLLARYLIDTMPGAQVFPATETHVALLAVAMAKAQRRGPIPASLDNFIDQLQVIILRHPELFPENLMDLAD